MKIINEQTLSRSDVKDKCLDYGKVFVEHLRRKANVKNY